MKEKRMRSIVIYYTIILCVILTVSIVGSKVVTVISENALPQRHHCVIIDAGHGGVDGGATSCSGVLESGINLEIALRLNDLLHLLGINTKMIRMTDISVYTEGQSIAAKKVSDLKNRVRIINETDNGLLVSIHQNHFSDSRYSGAQVFYPNTQGSEKFARNLQSLMIQTLNNGSRRQAKRADGIYLMQNIRCPGILIECGFLSNPEEDYKLRSALYQKKLCSVIASAVSLHIAGDLLA